MLLLWVSRFCWTLSAECVRLFCFVFVCLFFFDIYFIQCRVSMCLCIVYVLCLFSINNKYRSKKKLYLPELNQVFGIIDIKCNSHKTSRRKTFVVWLLCFIYNFVKYLYCIVWVGAASVWTIFPSILIEIEPHTPTIECPMPMHTLKFRILNMHATSMWLNCSHVHYTSIRLTSSATRRHLIFWDWIIISTLAA